MSDLLEALRAEQAGYVARGMDDRAAQVQAQIDDLTGAAQVRAAVKPVRPRGRKARA